MGWRDPWRIRVLGSGYWILWWNYYFFGKAVTRRQVPTGSRIKRIIRSVQCSIPEIRIETIRSVDTGAYAEMPVWQKGMIDPDRHRWIVQNFEVHALDRNRTVEELMKIGEPFSAKFKNFLRLQEGRAGFRFILWLIRPLPWLCHAMPCHT